MGNSLGLHGLLDGLVVTAVAREDDIGRFGCRPFRTVNRCPTYGTLADDVARITRSRRRPQGEALFLDLDAIQDAFVLFGHGNVSLKMDGWSASTPTSHPTRWPRSSRKLINGNCYDEALHGLSLLCGMKVWRSCPPHSSRCI